MSIEIWDASPFTPEGKTGEDAECNFKVFIFIRMLRLNTIYGCGKARSVEQVFLRIVAD